MFPTSSIQATANKPSSLFSKGASSSAESPPSSAEQELLELESTMLRIKAMLDDAAENDVDDKYEQLRLSELQGVIYDIEDLMDEYEYEALRVTVEARRQAMASHMDSGYDEVFDCSNPLRLPISDELAIKVKEIRGRFQEITHDWNTINLYGGMGGGGWRERRRRPRDTTSWFDDSLVFGRESEKEETISWLLGVDEPNGNTISVRRIVGVGGIGKTTFAQMIFKDPRVAEHFYYRGWIHMSDIIDLPGIKKRIANSFFMTRNDNMCLEDLDLKYWKEKLEGKSFFLVLDDAWNSDHEFWNSFKSFITAVEAGGKVIVTTRDKHVAKSIETTPPLDLEYLSFHDCWALFSNYFDQNFFYNQCNEFLEIGRCIIAKCKRLPLTVKVLAGILRFEDDVKAWEDILESELWELDEEIMPALKLSYRRMPIELRPCFKYLSLFPKDSILEKSTIIQQWTSQGFLSSKGRKTTKYIGNAYLDEFLQRSLLQYSDSCSNDAFIMHDLIHDLAQSVGKGEFLLMTNKSDYYPTTERHISMHVGRNYEKTDLKCLSKMQSLRTLILQGDHGFPNIVDSLSTLTNLRTLVLEDDVDLSYVIGNLKHLRYLHLRDVPESVYKLYHLQTLKSDNEIKLTEGVGDLISLQHLYGYERESLPHVIRGLTGLQTLEEISLGSESWQCKLRHLNDFTNLSGSLTVRGLETVRWSDVTSAHACLMSKSKIENLRLYWNEQQEDKKLAEEVLDCLRPHEYLERLYIERYSGDAFPMCLSDGSLFRLKELELRLCKCTSMPTLGQLPALKRLRVSMERVKSVGREFLCSSKLADVAYDKEDVKKSGCFHFLEFLRFEWMKEWKEWNGIEESDFPFLRQLELYDCPKLKVLPFLTSLAELKLEREFHRSVLSSRLLKLQILHIYDYQEVSIRFPRLQNFPSLVKLVIEKCTELRTVSGLGNLVALQHLVIDRCPILKISPSERMHPNLLSVTIQGSPNCEKWCPNGALQQRNLSWNSKNDSRLVEFSDEQSHVSQASESAQHQAMISSIRRPLKRENDSVSKELDEVDNCEQKRGKL